VRFTVPVIGDKKRLLELSLRNAFQYRRDKLNRMEKKAPGHRTDRLLQRMQEELRLPEAPRRIECFDNSNIQGAFPVAAMSVFIDGKPARSEYRHFNIRTVTGPDDFASMEEVIYRRYRRRLDENSPLPQLIVIDGGKGQLGSALNSLRKLDLEGKVAVIGIAKKLEEIYYPGDSLPLYLDKKGETLKIIQRLRDEAHRFGIEHHRGRRSKGVIRTELTGIKGIGEATARLLLQRFKSVAGIKAAGMEALTEAVGKAKAEKIRDYFSAGGDAPGGEPLNP
jgi:excinuclease ABC subunit C